MTAETMAKDETQDATDPTEAGKPPAPTTHLKLLSWVEEVARLTQPDSVHWCTGSNEEWTSLTDALVELGNPPPARPRQEAELLLVRVRPLRRRPGRGPHVHLLRRRVRLRPHEQLDGTRRDEGGDDRPVPRIDAGPDDVRHPVRHGSPRRRAPDVRSRDHRLRLRRRLDARDGAHGQQDLGPDGRARRRLRRVPALGRGPAGARSGRRAVGLQRHEVHQPLP